jgi:hypothetical protein
MSEAPDLEMKAMQEIGRLRTKVGTWSFVIAWPALTALMFFVGLGLIWAFLLAAVLAGAASKAFVSSQTNAIIEEACRRVGVSRVALGAERYILK